MHLRDSMLDFYTPQSGYSNQEMVLVEMLFSFASHWSLPESIAGVCIPHVYTWFILIFRETSLLDNRLDSYNIGWPMIFKAEEP